jgi:hypothetical protein
LAIRTDTGVVVVVSVVLGLWFFLSVAVQMSPALLNRVRKFDYAYLIPRWNFFAPIPGDRDFHLLYRDKLQNDSLGSWVEVVPPEPAHPLNFLWNPAKRYNKALVDICQRLAVEVEAIKTDGRDPQYVTVTVPYLLILNHVTQISSNENVRGRQFLLMTSGGTDQTYRPHPIFLSSVHREC